ncbi:MAG: helicase C-terminal domain-containing protein [Dehalococcoidia bacterium]|nr:helicase C-terminal domain-containing protein [Dehalococcoidia bacterium]
MNQVCVSLDLETTGVRPESDQIIEVAAIKFQGDRVLDRFETLVNPRCPLPLRTDRLTRITPADLQGAPTIDQIASKLIKFVQNCPLVGQSLHIDLSFLARKGIPLDNLVYDTFELASILLPDLANYNLGAVALHLGIHFPVQHRAMPDAEAAMRVMLALAKKASALDSSVLSELTRLAQKSNWPLYHFFQLIEKEKSRTIFTSSIAEQLSGKMGLEELNMGFLTESARRGEVLCPTDEIRPIDPARLGSFLEPGGLLSRRFPGFESRPQQLKMMRAVIKALNEGSHVIAEAGTGTGKSLAYLLPSVAFATANSRHVVISTNTINLQEQLVCKDIPDLRAVLADGQADTIPDADGPLASFRTAVVKGRSNYLCLRRWTALRKSEGLTMDETRVLIRILVWLPSTQTGDRSELNLMPGEAAVWGKICAHADNCMASKCKYQQRGTCFLFRARRRAENAHLIVVNHALLLSDIASDSSILPDYSHLIIDEAHHLEDEATNQFGFEANLKVVSTYLDRIAEKPSADRRGGFLVYLLSCLKAGQIPQTIRRDFEKQVADSESAIEIARLSAASFFQVVADFVKHNDGDSSGYDKRVLINRDIRTESGWEVIRAAWADTAGRLGDVDRELEVLAGGLGQGAIAKIEDYDDLLTELRSLISAGGELRLRINAVVNELDDKRICWISTDAAISTAALHEAPLHVGEMLNRTIFSAKDSVILTSATLSTEGTFDYLKERLGLEKAEGIIVDSPFDYKASALLLICNDIPEPGKPGYQRKLELALLDLCRAAEGRTLVLFTSNSALRTTYGAIKPSLEKDNILVVGHGIDGSRRQLLTTFKSNPRTVLMGTSSFWEGIDVVGDALSILAIAKLPFNVPSDPIFRARSAMFHDAFNQFAVPQTILKFKQGFGRLIRSQTDRGVVAILDSRVDTKSYGAGFIESLPTCTLRRTSSTDIQPLIRRWLANRD